MTTVLNLTIENFTATTGFRFRISREQGQRIKAGTLTREQAMQEFLANGGLERLKVSRRPDVPDEVFTDPTLTIANFSDKVKNLTGVSRRFRVTQEQRGRIAAGTLSREQALAEIVKQKKG